MKQIVTANDCRVRVRKKRKGEAHFLRMPAIYFDGIDADGRDMHTAPSEIRKVILKTPQLGVTERSPVSPIKNQHRSVGRKQIPQCH